MILLDFPNYYYSINIKILFKKLITILFISMKGSISFSLVKSLFSLIFTICGFNFITSVSKVLSKLLFLSLKAKDPLRSFFLI